MDALNVLTDLGGTFQNVGCYFVSTVTTGEEGRHNTLLLSYVACEVVFPHHKEMKDLTEQMAKPFLDSVDVLACAATGDIALLVPMADFFNESGYPVQKVWADKQPDGSYKIERMGWAELVKGKRVLVVNDRMSQGGTTRKVINEVRRLGGDVIGVSVLSSPSDVTAETLGVPWLESLCIVDVVKVMADTADKQQRELPVAVDIAHGSEFRQENPDWPGGFVRVLDQVGTLIPA